MKKIVLLCSEGMSTGILVNKILDCAKKCGKEYDISAHAVTEASIYGADADLILLGPQVRFNLTRVKDELPGKIVDVIDMRDYGTMNADGILKKIQGVIGD